MSYDHMGQRRDRHTRLMSRMGPMHENITFLRCDMRRWMLHIWVITPEQESNMSQQVYSMVHEFSPGKSCSCQFVVQRRSNHCVKLQPGIRKKWTAGVLVSSCALGNDVASGCSLAPKYFEETNHPTLMVTGSFPHCLLFGLAFCACNSCLSRRFDLVLRLAEDQCWRCCACCSRTWWKRSAASSWLGVHLGLHPLGTKLDWGAAAWHRTTRRVKWAVLCSLSQAEGRSLGQDAVFLRVVLLFTFNSNCIGLFFFDVFLPVIRL